MDEFTMNAFAGYDEGSSTDAFATVSARSIVACFGAMAAEVADWLPRALADASGGETPRGIVLTLEWSGAPAPTPAPDRPESPSGPANRRVRRPWLNLRRSGRDRFDSTAAAPGVRPAPARAGLAASRPC